MEWVYAALAGYLFGSLPFAYWFGVLQNKNLLAEGSGNVGGTNAWRVLGPVPGLMVMILDVAKGLMAVALGEFLARDPGGGLLGGAWPCWDIVIRCGCWGAAARALPPPWGLCLPSTPGFWQRRAGYLGWPTC